MPLPAGWRLMAGDWWLVVWLTFQRLSRVPATQHWTLAERMHHARRPCSQCWCIVKCTVAIAMHAWHHCKPSTKVHMRIWIWTLPSVSASKYSHNSYTHLPLYMHIYIYVCQHACNIYLTTCNCMLLSNPLRALKSREASTPSYTTAYITVCVCVCVLDTLHSMVAICSCTLRGFTLPTVGLCVCHRLCFNIFFSISVPPLTLLLRPQSHTYAFLFYVFSWFLSSQKNNESSRHVHDCTGKAPSNLRTKAGR